jgi:hypothetical protein
MPSPVALLAASALLAIVLLGTASTGTDHVSRLCEMAEHVASGQMNASDAQRWFAALERRNVGLDRGELMKAARGGCPAVMGRYGQALMDSYLGGCEGYCQL